jgi:hypothetical protein
MIRTQLAVASLLALLAGCAAVSVQALAPDGRTAAGLPGLRYYMPRPYLLVTALPSAAAAPATAPAHLPPADPNAAIPPPPAGGAATAPTTTTPSQAAAGAPVSTAPASNTSYQAQNAQYQVKLIYLPDLSRPMAITMTAGLLGTANMNPVLQDGWMLTSLQGQTDNQGAATLNAISAVLGSALLPKPATAAATAAAPAKKAGGPGTTAPDWILRPGLFALNYDDTTGRLTGLCAAGWFSADRTPGIPDCQDAPH